MVPSPLVTPKGVTNPRNGLFEGWFRQRSRRWLDGEWGRQPVPWPPKGSNDRFWVLGGQKWSKMINLGSFLEVWRGIFISFDGRQQWVLPRNAAETISATPVADHDPPPRGKPWRWFDPLPGTSKMCPEPNQILKSSILQSLMTLFWPFLTYFWPLFGPLRERVLGGSWDLGHRKYDNNGFVHLTPRRDLIGTPQGPLKKGQIGMCTKCRFATFMHKKIVGGVVTKWPFSEHSAFFYGSQFSLIFAFCRPNYHFWHSF